MESGRCYTSRIEGVRASTLPELLVAMVLSGLVLFFAYEGIGLLQRRLAAGTAQWQLIHSHAVMERLMYESDSIRTSGPELVFYSFGKPSDTLTIAGKSVVYRRIAYVDTLFSDADVKIEKYHTGNTCLVKSLDIFMRKQSNDTLHLRYLSGASSYIESMYRY